MSGIKIGFFRGSDMKRFAGRSAERTQAIMKSRDFDLCVADPMAVAAETDHPIGQAFVIDGIIENSRYVRTYTLKKKDGTIPAHFRAGQFVAVREMIGNEVILRPFFLSSSPSEAADGIYRITVAEKSGGILTEHMAEVWRKGREVAVSAPYGTFCYNPVRDFWRVVAVADSIGIFPFLSMARAIDSGDEKFPLTVFYCGKDRDDIIFRDELDLLVKKNEEKLRVIYMLSDEDEDGYVYGSPSAAMIRKFVTDPVFSLFVAGTSGFCSGFEPDVRKLKVKRRYYRKSVMSYTGNLRSEDGYPPLSANAVFRLSVTCCSRVRFTQCKASEPLSSALERAGIAGAIRCHSGQCGWCRSKLLQGEVFVPDGMDFRKRSDIDAGYVHPCVSYPLSDISLEIPNTRGRGI